VSRKTRPVKILAQAPHAGHSASAAVPNDGTGPARLVLLFVFGTLPAVVAPMVVAVAAILNTSRWYGR